MNELEAACKAVLDDARCKCRRRAVCVGCTRNLKALNAAMQKREEIRKSLPGASLLSDREIQVVKEFGLGRCPKQISTVLGISKSTVEKHKNNIMEKLGIHSMIELILWSIRIGLVSTY